MEPGTVIWLCVVWLACATALLLTYIRRDRPKARESRRSSASMIVLVTVGVLSTVAHMLNWPHYVELAIDGLGALVAAGIVIWLVSARPFRHALHWIKDPPSPRR